jgi:hypothetical protein
MQHPDRGHRNRRVGNRNTRRLFGEPGIEFERPDLIDAAFVERRSGAGA